MIGKGMGTTDSYQGGKMNWERVRPARGGWRPAKHILQTLAETRVRGFFVKYVF